VAETRKTPGILKNRKENPGGVLKLQPEKGSRKKRTLFANPGKNPRISGKGWIDPNKEETGQ